jgi:hypothetical protein
MKSTILILPSTCHSRSKLSFLMLWQKRSDITSYIQLITTEAVATAVTAEYPRLKNRTGTEGWEALKASFKFKMGNARDKLRQAGCLEALVNAGERSQLKSHLAAPHKGVKKARRREANNLPDIAAGTDNPSTDELQTELQECMMATTNDLTTINKLIVFDLCHTASVNNRTANTCKGNFNSVAGTHSSYLIRFLTASAYDQFEFNSNVFCYDIYLKFQLRQLV